MKITLIYPLLSKERSRIDENKQYWPPLGLAYIAAVLEKKGCCVQILDRDYILRKSKFDFEEADRITLESIKNFGMDIVGFSATTPNISDVNLFSKKIKSFNPGILTVMGGPHCVGEPVFTLEMCAGIDVIVRGEGELTMLDIALGRDLDAVAGITYRGKDGAIVSNPDRPLIVSLDSLPLPARHLLDMDYYTRPSRFISRNLSLRTTHIFTARGCPYNCHYCAGPLMGRRTVRYHSAQRVVFEIEELINKYSVEAVYFAEDMFLSDKKRAQEMAALFIERGINKRIVWMAQLNPNVADKELLAMMKKSGCVHVEYGFESGSQRTLEAMNKRTNVGRNRDAARLTRKIGLRFQGNFIVGYPGETEEDFNKTITFIKDTRPNNISLNIFMPLPGTEIYKKLKKEGKEILNWDDFGNPEAPAINYADMPKSYFEELYFKAKLKVVLPLNFIHFIMDNKFHPIRLIYVLTTQFKSVLIRAIKANKALVKLNRKSKGASNVFFIAYHSISYPIMESQALSYIRALSKYGTIFSLLTFETKDTRGEIRSSLKAQKWKEEYNWREQFYYQKPRAIATLFNIICGQMAAVFIIKKDKIKIVHARGLISALIAFLPCKLYGIKFFFDTRGLLADKYVGGGLIKKGSFIYKTMRLLEDYLVKRSDFFTVETFSHAKVFRDLSKGAEAKMEVIPCCVDTAKFNYLLYSSNFNPSGSNFNLVYLGKIGTWYLLEEMLDFFQLLAKNILNSRFTFLTTDEPESIYMSASCKGIDRSRIIVKRAAEAQIPALLSQSDIGIFFINPYKRYNSSPIKYGEYLASGLPVVINSGIGDTEAITEEENIGAVVKEFDNANYDAAIKKIKGLLENKAELKKRCRAAAEKHLSLEKGVEKYNRIYQKLSLQ